MSDNQIVTWFDLNTMEVLPPGWIEDIYGVIAGSARAVEMQGESSTSREELNASIKYEVVTGDVIRERLPWLWNLYEHQFVGFATSVAGRPMKISKFEKSAINMNVLNGTEARYEWHVDSNPLTGLVYVNSLTQEDGGELVFEVGGRHVPVYPRSGHLAFFDARELPHTVMPLKKDLCRISIPMNFFFAEEDEVRPADLDDHIYGPSVSASPHIRGDV